jgi:hypothetical protein
VRAPPMLGFWSRLQRPVQRRSKDPQRLREGETPGWGAETAPAASCAATGHPDIGTPQLASRLTRPPLYLLKPLCTESAPVGAKRRSWIDPGKLPALHVGTCVSVSAQTSTGWWGELQRYLGTGTEGPLGQHLGRGDPAAGRVVAGYDPPMTIWNTYGYRDSPYATEPVPPNAEGEQLFVGRADELRRLGLLLTSSATHPTVEGENGVGKTSLVAIAGYHARRQFEASETSQLLIPLPEPFQMTPSEDLVSFIRRLYFAVAQAFIDNHDLMRSAGMPVPDTGDVGRWINSPIFSSSSAGATVLGSGLQGSHSSSPNTSAGFTEAGFQAAVERWLRECFPSRQAGGFVCVLDNLELLQTHRAARELLEGLRDAAFNRPGLRWVLCGARGIMRSAASSSRLQGVLAEPMELQPLPDESVPDVIARRLEVFQMSDNAYAPVEPDGFLHLYEVGNRNLRNALKYCEDYAFWLSMEGDPWPESAKDKLELLETWMAVTAEKYLVSTGGVGERAWEVFDGIVAKGGSISPSDFEDFGFETSQAMRGQMRALEDSVLVESSVDETDKRRRLIEITARGWIVNYQRSGYKTPRELAEGASSVEAGVVPAAAMPVDDRHEAADTEGGDTEGIS